MSVNYAGACLGTKAKLEEVAETPKNLYRFLGLILKPLGYEVIEIIDPRTTEVTGVKITKSLGDGGDE